MQEENMQHKPLKIDDLSYYILPFKVKTIVLVSIATVIRINVIIIMIIIMIIIIIIIIFNNSNITPGITPNIPSRIPSQTRHSLPPHPTIKSHSPYESQHPKHVKTPQEPITQSTLSVSKDPMEIGTT